MKVSELGEFGLIDLLAEIAGRPKNESVLIGIGDDAACWRAESALQLATTDALIQDVHFDLSDITWRELGWKALAVNLSDIAAMGGIPRYALVSLGLPSDTDVDNVSDLYKGMMQLARGFDVDIIGGNITAAPAIMISLTVLGEATTQGNILTRSAAAPGDRIAVTGALGASAAWRAMLKRRLKLSQHAAKALREAHVKPRPRVAEGQTLARRGVKAAIDLSDGLLADLEKLCKASGVGARISADRIPVDSTVRRSFDDDALSLALGGGEDYELLFTAPGKIIDRVKEELPCPATAIGEITTGTGVKVIDEKGLDVKMKNRGWDHFAKRGQR
jgi:thiamine-monophosphate kinase